MGEEHGREFLAIRLDVTDYEAVGAAVEQVVAWRGRIDALVNSAGWNKLEPLIEMDPATWLRTLDVDLTGTFNCLRHVLPVMRDGGGGAVVNISSIAAWETSTEHGAAYSAAKAGVTALTRVAAAEMWPVRDPRQRDRPGPDLQRIPAQGLSGRVLRGLRRASLPRRAGRPSGRRRGAGLLPALREGRLHHRRGLRHQRRRVAACLTANASSGRSRR